MDTADPFLAPSNEVTDPCNIFVKYLPSDIDDAKLLLMFEPYGKIESCRVMVDPRSKQSLGYGFVRYEAAEQAQVAIEKLNRTQVGNKTLLCKLSIPPHLNQPEPSNNLYIKNLPPDMMESGLKILFSPYGIIEEVRVMVDPLTGFSRQIGFVRFSTKEQAAQAIEAINGRPLSGAPAAIQVKYADSEKQKLDRRNRINYSNMAGHVSPSHTPKYPQERPSRLHQIEEERLNAQLQKLSIHTNDHYFTSKAAPAWDGGRAARNYSISPTGRNEKRSNSTSPRLHMSPFTQSHGYFPANYAHRNQSGPGGSFTTREHYRTSKSSHAHHHFGHGYREEKDSFFHRPQPRNKDASLRGRYSQGHNYTPNALLHTEYHPTGYNLPYMMPLTPPFVGIPPVSPEVVMSVPHSPSLYPASPHSPPMGYYPHIPFTLSGNQGPYTFPPPLGLGGIQERPTVENTNLFIFHLPPEMTETKLVELFLPFGQIDSVKVVKDHVTGDSRGYGFVRYYRIEDAQRAIREMNGYQIGRKNLKVSFNKSNQH